VARAFSVFPHSRHSLVLCELLLTRNMLGVALASLQTVSRKFHFCFSCISQMTPEVGIYDFANYSERDIH
jgi:hypothetical protein